MLCSDLQQHRPTHALRMVCVLKVRELLVDGMVHQESKKDSTLELPPPGDGNE